MPKQNFHIAFFLAAFSQGGAQSVMVNLANSMAKKGLRIDFIAADCTGPFLNQVDSQVNIIDLKTKRMSRSLFGLVAYLKQAKPDILLSTQKHTNITACLTKFFLKTKTKIVLRESSTPSKSYEQCTIKNKIVYQIAKLFYPYADYFIGQSDGLSRDFMTFYNVLEEKLATIPNPIISKKIIELSEAPCDHPWFQEETPILMSIGRSCVAKDFATLIRAFSIVRKQKACRLIILGAMASENAAIFNNLKKLIKELGVAADISFPGFKDNPFPYLRKAKVYVLSSIYEGLPGALIQAMAMGCNVVATDCPNGPKEIIDRGESGILVPVKDFKKLAAGILHHLNNPMIPKYNLSVFEEDHAVQAYLSAFEKISTN